MNAKTLSTKEIPMTHPLQNHYLYSRRRVQTIPGPEPSMTQQQFKSDCDINNILKKYQKTGAINHFAKYSPIYGDYQSRDLQEAYELVKRAEKMFADLPSSIRNEVGTPQGFLDFVQNPSNASRMRDLGLTKGTPAPITPPSPEAK